MISYWAFIYHEESDLSRNVYNQVLKFGYKISHEL
jgi:hypothetical protein